MQTKFAQRKRLGLKRRNGVLFSADWSAAGNACLELPAGGVIYIGWRNIEFPTQSLYQILTSA